METLIVFLNIVAVVLFMVSTAWWALTVYAWIWHNLLRDQNHRRLEGALHGRTVFPVARRSIMPMISGAWLLAVWLTNS